MNRGKNANIKSIAGNKAKKGIQNTRENTQIHQPPSLTHNQPQHISITISDKPKSVNRKGSQTPNQIPTSDSNSNSTNNNPTPKPNEKPQSSGQKKPLQKRNKHSSEKELTENLFQGRNKELFTKSEDNSSTCKHDYGCSNYTIDGYNKRNNNILVHQTDDCDSFDDKPLLIRTISILQLYIKNLKEKYEAMLSSVIRKANDEMKSLKNEKDCLIKANNQLKRKIIEMIYAAKVFDCNEERRGCEVNRAIQQVVSENCFLRRMNDLCLLHVKEGDSGIADKSLGNDKGVSENKREESKGKHKRQKTQFKFSNEINDKNSSDGQSPKFTTISLISNDAFKDSILEINKLSKTMKKTSNADDQSQPNTKDIIPVSSSSSSSSSVSSLTIITKKQPLCYITPTSKDKKLIEFTQ